jgi:hypothetical protein
MSTKSTGHELPKVTAPDLRKAEKRMQAQLNGQPCATSARFDRRGARIVVGLSSGLDLGVPVNLAQGLGGRPRKLLPA